MNQNINLKLDLFADRGIHEMIIKSQKYVYISNKIKNASNHLPTKEISKFSINFNEDVEEEKMDIVPYEE